MAIKVQNTTVISDARALQNISNVDVATVETLRAAGLGSGGSGLFNTSISSATGYAVTTTMANAYVAAATVGKTYIAHSIHVTNISSTANVNVSGQLVGVNYSNVSFANSVPLPIGTSVELLKKPKVLQANDYIQLLASANSNAHVMITIEEVNDTKLFGAGIDLVANTYTDLYTATANSVIESILLSNDDANDFDVKSTVVWTDSSNTIQGYISYEIIVPINSTVEVLEQPKFLPNGHKIRVQANEINRLEAIIAGKAV
jgi:hypothetical protein